MIFEEELLKYISKKNLDSIKIDDEEYFVSQRINDKVPCIEKDTARFLYFLSSLIMPEYVLEIGYGSGYSSWVIYLGAKDSIKKIYSFEHEAKRYMKGIKFINRKDIPIEIINKDFSLENLKKLTEENKLSEFDLIFVDGTKREYPLYFKESIYFLKKGGLILFDNILFNGNLLRLSSMEKGKNVDGAKILKNFLDIVSETNEILPFFLPFGDGILMGIKK